MLSADITGTSAADRCDVTRDPPSGVEWVLKMESDSAVAVVVEALVVITEAVVAVAVVVAERIVVVVK